MIRLPARSTRTYRRFPYTTLFRSMEVADALDQARGGQILVGLPTDYVAAQASPELGVRPASRRSEEHTSELQSLMRNSYAVFCLKKKDQHMNIMTASHHCASQHPTYPCKHSSITAL